MQTPSIDLPHVMRPSLVTCCHRRLVDPVLTEQGEDTGTVRCLECGRVIPDPIPRSAH
ncbi:MAG: hypothetical protein JSR20_02225 [Nitrospira sp.]|nr:hypothetical protein [Nitrospira sp.]